MDLRPLGAADVVTAAFPSIRSNENRCVVQIASSAFAVLFATPGTPKLKGCLEQRAPLMSEFLNTREEFPRGVEEPSTRSGCLFAVGHLIAALPYGAIRFKHDLHAENLCAYIRVEKLRTMGTYFGGAEPLGRKGGASLAETARETL